jgi:NAD(P)-dependent dehydrogenase (short-subunit alcohol dehydrogenase family)
MFDNVLGDLGSLRSVADLASQVREKAQVLDAIWNNAGGIQYVRKVSEDGVELQMAVNYLAPFALTRLLLPLVKESPQGRIVFTSSSAHSFAPARIDDWLGKQPDPYLPMAVYGQSKLAIILFTQELARRLAGTSVTIHVFDPGFVRTDFMGRGDPKRKKYFFEYLSFLAIPPDRGADTGVFLVDEEAPSKSSGVYWMKRKPSKTSRAVTPEAAARLWEQSEAAVQNVLGE